MPAAAKPSKVLARSGAFRQNPQRTRVDPEGVGKLPSNPPATLTEGEQAVWREVVAVLPAIVITGSEAFAVERVAVLLYRARTADKFTAAEEGQLRCYLHALGLLPSGRASLGIKSIAPKANEFDEF